MHGFSLSHAVSSLRKKNDLGFDLNIWINVLKLLLVLVKMWIDFISLTIVYEVIFQRLYGRSNQSITFSNNYLILQLNTHTHVFRKKSAIFFQLVAERLLKLAPKTSLNILEIPTHACYSTFSICFACAHFDYIYHIYNEQSTINTYILCGGCIYSFIRLKWRIL